MKYIFAALMVLGLVACTSKQGSRQPNSDEAARAMAEMSKSADFWAELEAAKHGSDPTYLINEEFKTGVFFKWMRANSIAAFKQLREKQPVLMLRMKPVMRNSPQTPESLMIVLSRAQDVIEVLKNSRDFSQDPERRSQEGTPYVMPAQSFYSPLRRGELGGFSSLKPEELQPQIRSLVEKILDEQMYVGRDKKGNIYGRLEVVNQLARRVPITLNQSQFGVSGPTYRETVDLGRALQDELFYNLDRNKAITQLSLEAYKAIADWSNAYEQRRTSPSVPDINFKKSVAGIFAGAEVTQTAATQAVNLIISRSLAKQAYDAANSKDEKTLQAMFNEALRFAPVRPYTVRRATKNVTLASGAKITKGNLLIVGTQSAMFDESVVPNPYDFNTNRPEGLYLHFERSGTSQIRDQISKIEAYEIFRGIVKQPGLRRAEGAAGQLDYRTIFRSKSSKLKDTFRYSFPEVFSVEFDAKVRPGRVEIPNKDYAYEAYLKDYDREKYRLCLSDLSKVEPASYGSNTYEESKRGFFGKLGAIYRSFEVTDLNQTRENKHLLFCRLPTEFRGCIARAGINILDHEQDKNHYNNFVGCSTHLSATEQEFYKNVFFSEPINPAKLTMSQAQRPNDRSYDFEDDLIFYDRYRARESMMNPGGFSVPTPEMLFYVRLNIDFRMCMGKDLLKYKYTQGLLGNPKEVMYPKCRDGVWNPQAQTLEGVLTQAERAHYEKIMFGQ